MPTLCAATRSAAGAAAVRSASTWSRAASRNFLTAGHCTEAVSTWSDSAGTVIGTDAVSRFPGDDYGLVRCTAFFQPVTEVLSATGTRIG